MRCPIIKSASSSSRRRQQPQMQGTPKSLVLLRGRQSRASTCAAQSGIACAGFVQKRGPLAGFALKGRHLLDLLPTFGVMNAVTSEK